MDNPPKFNDFGKPARNILNKYYNYGGVKVIGIKMTDTTKTKVSFNYGLIGGETTASLMSKCVTADQGITLRQRWSSPHQFSSEISCIDKLLRGTTLGLEARILPYSKDDSDEGWTAAVKSKAHFVNSHVNTNLHIDFNDPCPVLNISALFGLKNFLAGYHVTYDSARIDRSNACCAFGIRDEGFELRFGTHNSNDFNVSVYHKVNAAVSLAVRSNWNRQTGQMMFDMAGEYKPSVQRTYKGKVNNQNQLGLLIRQQISETVFLTFSTLIDVRKFRNGDHKLGVGLEFIF